MKIDKFRSKKLTNGNLNNLFGGKEKPNGAYSNDCDGNVIYEDTWYDNDNDGEISPGDRVCYNGCFKETKKNKSLKA